MGCPLLSRPRTIELTSYNTVLIFTDRAIKMVHLIHKPHIQQLKRQQSFSSNTSPNITEYPVAYTQTETPDSLLSYGQNSAKN